MGIVPEDRHLVGSITAMSLIDNLFLDRSRVPTRFGLMRRAGMRKTALAMMQTYDIRAAGPDVAFGSLSGGNQQKAVLARELTAPNLKVLLTAQPTRGLDVGRGRGGLRPDPSRLRSRRRRPPDLVRTRRDPRRGGPGPGALSGRIVGECPAEPGQRKRIGALMAGQAA